MMSNCQLSKRTTFKEAEVIKSEYMYLLRPKTGCYCKPNQTITRKGRNRLKDDGIL